MELLGEQRLALPREKVWAALNDPAVLRQCVPGCDSFESTGDNGYRMTMTASVGPVKARFNGRMTLSDLDPPRSYVLSFDGSGGAAGSGKGGARVTLDADGDSVTLLRYSVSAQVGGRLAQVGTRLIDSVARRMAGEFFDRFQKTIAPFEAMMAVSTASARPSTPVPAASSPRVAVPIWAWACGAVLVACVVLAYVMLRQGA